MRYHQLVPHLYLLRPDVCPPYRTVI